MEATPQKAVAADIESAGSMSEVNESVSIVIPFFNEEGNVLPLMADIEKGMRPMGIALELVAADDRSPDQTFARLKEAHERYETFRVIRFRKNFGQSPALSAALVHGRGEIIATHGRRPASFLSEGHPNLLGYNDFLDDRPDIDYTEFFVRPYGSATRKHKGNHDCVLGG